MFQERLVRVCRAEDAVSMMGKLSLDVGMEWEFRGGTTGIGLLYAVRKSVLEAPVPSQEKRRDVSEKTSQVATTADCAAA